MDDRLKTMWSRVATWLSYRPARAVRLVVVLVLLGVPLAACSVTRPAASTASTPPAAAATTASSGGSSATSPATSTTTGTTPTASASGATTTPSTATTTPSTPATASSPASPAATPAGTAPSAAQQAAIKAVIERGNQEQAQALAANNPALMQDSATSSYYSQLVQTQTAMVSQGVSSIKLDKLTWQSIVLTSPTTARAVDVETWSTTLNNGSTQQQSNTNVYTLVLQGGSWKVSADQQPGSQQTPSTTSDPSGVPNPVVPIAPAGASGNVGQSENWAGYAATGGTFTSVSGSWTVPQVSATGSTGADATWVGIGGVVSTDLIQAGTDASVQGGQVTYAAWLETLPQAQQIVPLAVNAGDTVSVSIAQQASGLWQITIHNDTTGKSYQTSLSYASTNSSAEWVEEAPAVGSNILMPLDNFGKVTITGASTVENGKTQTIAQAGGQEITMYATTGQVLAQPSSLAANGAGFTVTRTAAQATPAGPGSNFFRRGGFSG
ncbi:MAG TPA: G1 family glutamic endopeptidase [Thermomicrobiaceae bacterium]|nr:G1 family glutamic endopeptidase [Thermomicrobiaceae bacterium]